jgi:hypothetical protein
MATPVPVVPIHCTALDQPTRQDQMDTWLNRQQFRCQYAIDGHEVGMRYPRYDPAITTFIRVELATQEQYVHVLAPGEQVWRIPEGRSDWLREAQTFVLKGVMHIFGHWIHAAFVLALCLLHRWSRQVGCITAFTAGQMLAGGLVVMQSIPSSPHYAEAVLALAVVFLALEAVRRRSGNWQLTFITAAAGLMHGGSVAASILPGQDPKIEQMVQWAGVVLGMDAAQLVIALVLTALSQRLLPSSMAVRVRQVGAYGIGSTAIALLLVLSVTSPRPDSTAAPAADRLGALLPAASGVTSTPLADLKSQRIASGIADTSLHSFLTIGPFEVRHEVLIRLRDMVPLLTIETSPDGYLEVGHQDDLKQQLSDYILSHTQLQIDAQVASPTLERIDLMTLTSTGVELRSTPVREDLQQAYIGVVISYLTTAMPNAVTLTWAPFPPWTSVIAATVIDPESSRSEQLTAQDTMLRWDNQLAQAPVPTIEAVTVEPPQVPVPLLSLLVLAVAIIPGIAALRGWRPTVALACVRVLVAGALIVAPLATTVIALPQQMWVKPTAEQARRILSALLPAVYRAFEFRQESAVYDRLAVSVDTSLLTQIYLEHRHVLEMTERGGARGRVEAVDVAQVGAVEPTDGNGFRVQVSWTVAGSVVHFGHRHYRKNQYQAWITIIAVDGVWKLRRLDIIDEQRLL